MLTRILISMSLIATPAMAMGKKPPTPVSCAASDLACWEKTAVSCPTGNQLSAATVLNDFDPGSDWKQLPTSDGNCFIAGHKLTAGMDTSKWIYGTSTEGWTANSGPWDVTLNITLPGINPDGSNSWIGIACTNGGHQIQPQQFEAAVASFMNLGFKMVSNSCN